MNFSVLSTTKDGWAHDLYRELADAEKHYESNVASGECDTVALYWAGGDKPIRQWMHK